MNVVVNAVLSENKILLLLFKYPVGLMVRSATPEHEVQLVSRGFN